jgi:hypothetical protein
MVLRRVARRTGFARSCCRVRRVAGTFVAMAAPTIHREQPGTPEQPPGPAAVLAALAEFSPAETLALIDAQIDRAYRESVAAADPGPLRAVLEHWWLVVRANRGEARPARTGGREQLAAALARRGAAD